MAECRAPDQLDCPELLTNREVEELRLNIHRLLMHVGDLARCRGCSAEIFWLIHRNGKKTPYDRDGKNHFITCIEREQFKKKGA